jgi:hypothetical protein
MELYGKLVHKNLIKKFIYLYKFIKNKIYIYFSKI